MDGAKENKRFWRVCGRFLCMLLIVAFAFTLSGCEDNEDEEDMGYFAIILGKKGNGSQAVEAKMFGESCWVCPYFKLAMDTSKQLYTELLPKVAAGALPLLGVLYGLFLAVHILKYVGSMKEPDLNEFWKGIGKATFWAAMGAAMLRNISWVIDFANGVFTGFVDFGVAVVATLPLPGGNISCPQGDPQSSFICLITAMQKKLNVGSDMAWVGIICGSPISMVIGVGCLIMSIIMGVYFPLLLMDGVFRYGIVMCFLPLAVVALCFSGTREWTKKVADAGISIGLQIVGLSIFVAMAAGILTKYIQEDAVVLQNPIGFLDNIPLIDGFLDGSAELVGFVFICIFLIFFAGVVMTIMSIFGGLSPSSMVSGAVMGIRNLASRVNNISKFATNRMNRIQDKKAKKLIEEAKGGGNVDAVKLEHAKNRLEDRGYLKQDKDGKMHETSAYRTMDKRGAFASMQRLSADLGMSSSQQREMRAGDGNELENELKV